MAKYVKKVQISSNDYNIGASKIYTEESTPKEVIFSTLYSGTSGLIDSVPYMITETITDNTILFTGTNNTERAYEFIPVSQLKNYLGTGVSIATEQEITNMFNSII